MNGVIQQPNAGTSTSGLDGFVVDTGTTGRIKFCAAPGSGADIFIVQLGDTVDIGTPSDNTVDLAQLTHATQGDVVYYGGSGVPARLSAGTSGYYLKTQGSGADPVWAAVPAGVGGATGVDFNDTVKARFGTGTDLAIYHSGSHSYIKHSGDGNLYTDIGSGDQYSITTAESAHLADFVAGGAVTLRHNGNAKIATSSTGATVTGTCTASVHTASNGIVETAATKSCQPLVTSLGKPLAWAGTGLGGKACTGSS